MSDANERQVGGGHYLKHGALQHWDVVAHFDLDYYQGAITKYVMRWKDKGGLEDLKKAQHYLEKYVELIESGVISKEKNHAAETVSRVGAADGV